MKFSTTLILIVLSIGLFSCKKNAITTSSSAKLNFSTDTLTFDTVFTTVGSTTGSFKVYNPSNKSIVISDIKLAGGSTSHFRINIDGVATYDAKSIEIAPKDSLYIFAAVTVDPNNQNNPFVITDSVVFQTNGNNQKVILEAWGQNAHFYNGVPIESQVWTNDKPYVIVNSLLIVPGATLTIMPGCKIYNHPGSTLYVQGTLKVLGQPGDSVTFQGDRLEPFFQGLPGNWVGIRLLGPSHDNVIENAIIRDGVTGVEVDSPSITHAPKLTIKQTIIRYMLNDGILAFTSSIYAENCLVFNVGQRDCLDLQYGGNYDIENCTFADYSNVVINHQNPAAYLSDYLYNGGSPPTFFAPLTALLRNCIFYGSLNKELFPDNNTSKSTPFSVTVSNCCIKDSGNVIPNATVNNSFANDPVFKDYTNDNYHLQSNSPCITNKGFANGVSVDLDNFMRGNPPDIGAYEFH